MLVIVAGRLRRVSYLDRVTVARGRVVQEGLSECQFVEVARARFYDEVVRNCSFVF